MDVETSGGSVNVTTATGGLTAKATTTVNVAMNVAQETIEADIARIPGKH